MNVADEQKAKLARGECCAPLCSSPWIECVFCPTCGQPFHLCHAHVPTAIHLLALHAFSHSRHSEPPKDPSA